jgi:hypothetical protein
MDIKAIEQTDAPWVSETTGARFYRADLHIHSAGSSHDVKDAQATPKAIVQAALDERLDIIAVTDHNDIRNVREAISHGQQLGVLVIPGVELSTPEGHVYNLGRNRNGSMENLDDSINGANIFPLESYRQGETNELSKRVQNDPLALLTFLDRLADTYPITASSPALLGSLSQVRQHARIANNKARIFFGIAEFPLSNKGPVIRAYNEFMAQRCQFICVMCDNALTALDQILCPIGS